jgi:hypothetical protein
VTEVTHVQRNQQQDLPAHLMSGDRRAKPSSSSSTTVTPSKQQAATETASKEGGPRINFVVNTQKLLDEANRKLVAMQSTIDSQQQQLQSQQRLFQQLQLEKTNSNANNTVGISGSAVVEHAEREMRSSLHHQLHHHTATLQHVHPWALEAAPMGNAASAASALLSYHEKNLSRQNNFAISNIFLEKLTLNRMMKFIFIYLFRG